MAGRRQDLETRLIAKDDASKVIDRVAGELDDLEKRDTSIDLTAEDHASDDVKSLSQLLAGLSDEDKTVVLNAKVSDAERNIDRILRSLRDVDKMDQQEIDVRVEMLGDVRAELDRVQTELRDLDGSTADVTVDVEARGLDGVMDKLESLPGLAGEVASSLGPGGAIVGALGAVAGAAAGVANEFANAATEARTMATLTGATVEDASRLQAVWKTTGADVNDLNDVILQMIGVLQTSPELAEQLGINIEDGATGVERFVQVMEKLRDFTGDASEKAVLLSQLLGEEGARQGAKLLTVVDDIAASMDHLSDGQFMTDEEAAKADKLARETAEMSANWDAIKQDLGEIVAGPMADFLEQVTGVLGGLEVLVSGEAFKPEFWEGAKRGGTDLLGIADEGLRREQERRRNADEINDVIRAGIELATRKGRAEEDAAARLAIAQGRETEGVLAKQEKLTKDEEARLGMALGRLAAYRDVQAAQAETNALALEFVEAMEAAAINVADAEGDMRDLAGVFSQMGKREDALQRVFDLGNAPLDAEGRVRDIELAIDDLSTAAEGIDLSEGLDPSNVKADALLDAIDSLRPQIQERVISAFSTGGPEAATKLAQDYIAQVAAQLGISEIEAAELLGMTDVQALVTVAIEQKSLANAQAQLDILTGLGGQTPLTASIALGLQAGTITPRQAKILIQEQLAGAGVEIPAELLVTPRPGALRRAREALQEETDANPVKQPVEVKDLPAAAESIVAGPQPHGWPTIEVPVKPVIVGGYSYLTGGGAGTLAAGTTAGPSLYGATAVPTAGPTLPTLMLPVAAPAQQQQPIVINNVINTAVVGDPYAVARAMEDGVRRAARLMPLNQ